MRVRAANLICRRYRVALLLVSITAFSNGARAQCRPAEWLPGDRLDGTVLAATVWDPDGSGPRIPLVLIGGIFNACQDVCRGIAAWNPTTGEWTGFETGLTNGYVETVATFPNGDFAIGGPFGVLSTASNGILIWNSRTGAWETSDEIVYEPPPRAMATLPSGELLFSSLDLGQIVRWNRETGTRRILGTGIEGLAVALVVLDDGDVVAGGVITAAGGVTVNNVARWDSATDTWSALGTGLTPVRALAKLSNGDLLACSSKIYRWRESDGAWSEVGPGQLGGECVGVTELADGDLVAIGSDGLVRYSTSTGLWSSVANQPPVGVSNVAISTRAGLAVGGFDGFAVFGSPDLPRIATETSDAMLTVNSTLALNASVASGYPNVSAQWLRNGVPITNGPAGASPGGGVVSGATFVLPSPTDATSAVLTIANVQPSDAGEYAVVFSNPCGSATSNAATVIVTASCSADFNSVGGVTIQDVLDFVTAWFNADPRADFNSVNGVTVQDIFDFLAAWFAGC